MMIIKYSSFICILALLSSCSNTTTGTKEEVKVEEQVEIHSDEDSHELRLNGEERWIANAETTEGVNNMIKLMNNFTEKDNVESYAVLNESIKSEFTMIFQKCTMKGEAHDQLHNFLIPIKDLFDGLSSEDLSICQKSFNELNTHLAKYSNFFE